MKIFTQATALALLAFCALTPAFAQAARQTWWTVKSRGGIYDAPNRPLWKLSDILKAHAGQDNWQQLVVRNAEQEATYNAAAPGTVFGRRMHIDTNTLYVVMAGEIRFTVEGQPPVTATRGSIVTVMNSTIFSYAAQGSQTALWVEVHPANARTVYPADDPPPAAPLGAQIIKVAFNHVPGVYAPPNQLHWNVFAAIAACAPLGVHVNVDHQFASALAGFARPQEPDGRCPPGRAPGPAPRGAPPPLDPAFDPPFDPQGVFGHMHAGMAEWWIVQAGHIEGRFENSGVFQGEEGDILYAPANTWHQLSYKGPGLSERLAITPYPFNNMNNTAAPP